MLTSFRKIRKSFLESSGARKYTLYAIGEILLVVIGILIALRINNWNEFRKDRVKEAEVIENLIENLELNIATLESDIDDLGRKTRSAQIILNVLDNRLSYHDSLAMHFHQARVSKTPLRLSQSGYEQFKNTGFDIMLDDEVKKKTITYFESTYPKWYAKYEQVNHLYVPFVDHVVPLFIYTREKLVPIDIDQLYEDDYYISWIRAYMEGRNTLILMENEFIEETRKVLVMLEHAQF